MKKLTGVGAEREMEREDRGGRGAGSGRHRNRLERRREFLPLPLRSHALLSKQSDIFIRLEARLQPNIGNTLYGARFDGVHAFGYNSDDSEPIWMKSGAL